jgi:hypothetical protein
METAETNAASVFEAEDLPDPQVERARAENIATNVIFIFTKLTTTVFKIKFNAYLCPHENNYLQITTKTWQEKSIPKFAYPAAPAQRYAP